MDLINPAKTEPTMFHYTNAAGLMGMIKNREVWATGSNYLNDPTEVSFAATALAAALRERLDGGDAPIGSVRGRLSTCSRRISTRIHPISITRTDRSSQRSPDRTRA